jgi:hypothetical protein
VPDINVPCWSVWYCSPVRAGGGINARAGQLGFEVDKSLIACRRIRIKPLRTVRIAAV